MRHLLCYVLLLVNAPAWATPITYGVLFDSQNGPKGEGSFVWHDDTDLITGFQWTFDGGLAGGFYDSAWVGGPVGTLAPTLSEYAFAVLGGEGTTTLDCTLGVAVACRLPMNPQDAYGYPLTQFGYFEFNRVSDAQTLFFIHDPVHVGGDLVLTPRIGIPEPGTLLLLLAGLLPILVRRRGTASALH